MITESNYLDDVGLDWNSFKSKIKSLIRDGDNMCVIYNSINGIKHYKVRKYYELR